MKALTLRHPWPWAICWLGKDIENRTWTPRPDQLKPGEQIAIHGGKAPQTKSGDIEVIEAIDWMDSKGLVGTHSCTKDHVVDPYASAIVAVATYDGAVRASASPWFIGPYGWHLDKVIVLSKPVKCRGAQGLWTMPIDVEARVMEQMQRNSMNR